MSFPAKKTLRPTPERVRETLFNWLTPVITGAHCLDVFAGSGALGFEALSRGAASVLTIESDKRSIAALNENAASLNALDRMQIHCCPFPKLLPKNFGDPPFDIIFLDPPFGHGIAQRTCDWLAKQTCLTPETYIYVEIERKAEIIPPENWVIHRETQCGEGRAILFKTGFEDSSS